MDELLQKAIERRDALRQELEAIEHFIHAYSLRTQAPSKPQQPDLFRKTSYRREDHRQAIDAMLADAEQMILDEGVPLTRGELLERLQAAGHKIIGGDKNKVLGTNLWRSRRFHNIQGAGYWPKSTPIPEPYASRPIRGSILS